MDLNHPDSSCHSVGTRPVPFCIDLNEAPLSSPRETITGDDTGPTAGVGNVKVGILDLDINALPTEAEVEETQHSVNFGIHSVQGASSVRNSTNAPVTCSNFLFGGSQFGLRGTPSDLASIFRSSFVDIIRPRGNFVSNVKDVDVYPALRGRNYATDFSVNTISFQNQSEKIFLLESLRKFMLDSHGVLLEDGWNVELLYCQKRCKPCAVYCSPDGHRFESVFDVACHLGLMSNRHMRGSRDICDGFSVAQNRLLLDRTKKESLLFSRTIDSNQCQTSLASKISLGIENRDFDASTSRSSKLESAAIYESSHYKDGFPVQFAEFFVLSLGEVDPRPSYHCATQIWPVGYKSSWHDKISGSLFVCDVSDGGDKGPIFKVQRYPCTTRAIPTGSTILSRPPSISTLNKEPENTFDIDAQMIFSDSSPPNLELNVLESRTASNCALKNPGGTVSNSITLDDDIGEFLVEGKSCSSVWKMVSEKLVQICRDMYKQNGVCEFSCRHSYHWCSSCIIYDTTTELPDSLSKFCHMYGPFDVARCVGSNDEISRTCEALVDWLGQDRFGLDIDFVQEMIEQLPGVHSFSDYIVLNSRSDKSKLQTIGNGFLLAKRENDSQSEKEVKCKASKERLVEDLSFPGKPLGSKLPASLVSDALQSWELLWRFSEILGLEETLSFEEFEEELIGMKQDTSNIKEVAEPMYKAHCSLLKVLLGEWESKLPVSLDPILESGESKSRKKRRKVDNLALSMKAMIDLLPVNELTWPELARRYFLFILPSEVNTDFPEAARSESRRVFRCLFGDSRVLYGPLHGVAVMEADELLLAEAMKQIFGVLKSSNDNLNVEFNETVAFSPSEEVKLDDVKVDDAEVPKWAEALYDVKRLPTNVGAKIRTRVYNALALDPPEWAAEILQHSISKGVYKGNASGPTKRAVLSVLAKVCGETQQPKPQPKLVKKKKSKHITLSDVIMRSCQRALYCALSDDKEKVFCNSLGRTLVNTLDDADEGIFGFPSMVSRPLDFRTIDLRLAFGTYRGSHEAFLEDVREVWNHIRLAYADQTNLRNLAEKLSQKFETLYEKEVLTLVEQLEGNTDAECLSAEVKSKIEGLFEQTTETSKGPWVLVCKGCGLDKDDGHVLLCDKCNSGHHIYCLDPPLEKVPDGNWFCPSCKSSIQDASQISRTYRKRRRRGEIGEFSHEILESLSHLIREMEVKDYWDYSVDERICLVKMLGDEVANSSCIHENVDQCAPESIDLQQKLRSLSMELRNLKLREAFLAEKVEKANASTLDNGLDEQRSFDSEASAEKHSEAMESRSVKVSDFQSSNQEYTLIKNKISVLEDSVASLELQLLKVYLRKDLLGKDSSGRSYWIFSRPSSSPSVIVDATNQEQFSLNNLVLKSPLMDTVLTPNVIKSIPEGSQFYFHQSSSEIEELIKWLRDNDPVQKELIDSLLHWLVHVRNYQPTSEPITVEKNTKSNSLKTRALMALEKNHGPCLGLDATATSVKKSRNTEVGFGERMWRCNCLELTWLSRYHCHSCHCSFSTRREIDEHDNRKCSFDTNSSKMIDDNSKGKRIMRTEQNRFVGFSNDMTSPFDFKEICDKFVIKNSNKELVKEIGLLGSNGVPSFVPSAPPNLTDPALKFISFGKDVSQTDQSGDNLSGSAVEMVTITGKRLVNKNKTCAIEIYKDLEEIGRLSDQSWLRLSYSRPGNDVSVIHEFSLRPLAGRGAQILRQLKICLLDIDAALPREAIKSSSASSEKRCTWRAFIKSAKSVFEMVQATIVLENMIKTEYLRNEWWYWSSISAAAKIANLSNLAVRIYSLDAAILYEKPCPLSPEEIAEVGNKSDDDSSAHTDVAIPKPAPSPTENGKPQSRSGKKRKDPAR